MKFVWLSRFLDQTDNLFEKIYLPLIAVSIIVIAVFVRKPFISFHSVDYDRYFSQWYDFFKMHGGFAALQYNFSDYNPPYLYLIGLATILPIQKIVAIKGISTAFDFFLAFIIYLLLAEKYTNKCLAFAMAASSLFLPTVILNSAMWGQSDSIYSSFCLLSLYFMMKKKGALSCISAAIALAFKLQAVFFLPILIVGVMKKEIRALYLLFIPLVYAISLLPALIAGRPISSLLLIYVDETKEWGARLSWNAANVYLWIPDSFFSTFKLVGIYFTLGLLLLLFFLILQFTGELTREMIIRVSFLFVLLIPFFLPQMHERYFYIAETLSIVYVVYFRQYFYIVLLLQIAGSCVYMSFLMRASPIPATLLPFFLMVVIAIVLFDFLKHLRSQPEKSQPPIAHEPDPYRELLPQSLSLPAYEPDPYLAQPLQ